MSNRYSLATVLLSLTLATAACSHQADPQPGVLDPLPPITQSQPTMSPADNADAAAALAAHASQYAHDVSPLLNQPVGKKPTTAPSIVQWVDPAPSPSATASAGKAQANLPLRIGAGTPATRPDSATADPANRGAILASSKINDDSGVPLILPASADHMAGGDAVPAAAGSSDEYEKKLAKQIHDYPRDLGNQLNYQLLRFARDEATPDLSAFSSLPAEDREVLSALLDGINNFRNSNRADANLLLSRKIQPFLEMSDRLRSQAELTIPTLELCTEVKSFGVYTPLPSARLPAGKENQVISYCEVSNFTSVENAEKIWETRLMAETVLYKENGMQVWPARSNAQTVVDHSRNRRHDFYVGQMLHLPPTLTIGRYLLKVTLTDQLSNRVCEATTPIEIVAQ